MGFSKEDTRKLLETDLTTFTRRCISAKLTFRGTGSNYMTKLQTRWWLDFLEKLKTRPGSNDLDEACICFGTNLPHKTPETIGRSLLEELRRCLDDRLKLSDEELHTVACGSDKETEEHDLKKLGKDNGRKTVLYKL